MKQITKERILKALLNSSRYANSKPETRIVHTLAKVGVNSAIGKASGDNRDPFTERDRIILAYQGFSDPLEISKRLSHIWADVNLDSATAIKQAWFASFESTIRRQQERTSRIVEIQKQHHVSGLEELEVNLGDTLVRFHCPRENY